MTDFEKYKEELSHKEKFYSLLTNRKTTDKEYEHVINIWKKFEINAMKDLHNLYSKCDVLLLVDVYGSHLSHLFAKPSISI